MLILVVAIANKWCGYTHERLIAGTIMVMFGYECIQVSSLLLFRLEINVPTQHHVLGSCVVVQDQEPGEVGKTCKSSCTSCEKPRDI